MFRRTRSSRFAALASALLLAVAVTGCSSDSDDSAGTAENTETTKAAAGDGGDTTEYPISVEHALGTTTIEEKPERVATVDFANQEVPLALGIVPVGMSKMTWGDDDGDGIQPWTEEALEELGGEEPMLFDETDGYDFEAVARSQPDVIIAGYSGMTKKDYETLSKIAPTVAYPDDPWATPWRESIKINSEALGMAAEGEQLVADLEKKIEEATSAYPQLEGATGAFLTHVDTTDLSEINFYSANDTRSKYLEDLGMEIAPSIKENSEPGSYSGSISSERADELKDVDVIITYGGQELIDALEADPVLSQLPAVKNGAIVNLDGTKPIGTAANPTALSIPALVDEYVKLLAEAVDKGEQ